MSTTAGAVSEALLRAIRTRQSELVGAGSRVAAQFIPQAEVLMALQAVSTAPIRELETQKENSVEIMWANVCGNEVTDHVDCEYGGAKPSTNTQTYKITRAKDYKFTVSEHDFIDNEFNAIEMIAKQMLMGQKMLIEEFAQYAVDVINNNLGVNVMGDKGKGCVSGNLTYIEKHFWDATLFAYLSRVANFNKFSSPVFVSGSLLYEQNLISAFNQANANGKGDAAMFGSMMKYFDEINIDGVNDPDLLAYVINAGSMAYASRALFPTSPQETKFDTRFSMVNTFMPGMKVDVKVEQVCEGDLVTYNYAMTQRADIFVNPTGCDENNTGLLGFACGACPAP